MKKIELKEKTAEKKVVPVTLPEGEFAYFCCADCDYSKYDISRNQYYCILWKNWVDGNDSCDIERRNSD